MPGAGAPRDESSAIVLLASTRDRLAAQEPLVRLLRDLGHRVRWAYAEGRLPRTTLPTGGGPEAGGDDEPHRLVAARTPSRAHKLALTVGPRVVGTARRVDLGVRFDPWFRRAVRDANHLVVLDDASRAAVDVTRRLGAEPTVHVGGTALADLVDELTAVSVRAQVREAHDELARIGATGPAASLAPEQLADLTRALDALSEAAGRRAALSDPGAVDLESADIPLRALPTLTRDARQVLEVVTRLEPVLGRADPVLAAYRTRAALDNNDHTTADPVGVAVALLETVDPLLVPGKDPGDDLTELVCLALDLVFHRELHSDSVDSPLVTDPVAHLEQLSTTRTWQLLTGSPQRGSRQREGGEETRTQRAPARVLVLPGAYGAFYRPVADAVQVSPAVQVRVAERSTLRPHLRTMGSSVPVVRERLRAAAGLPVNGYPELRSLVSGWGPDVLFVDWADKTAVLATLLAAPHTRIVLRVHGVDALRPWIHLLDWDRVDALVSVSTPLLDLVRDVVGEPARATRAHVIPHMVDLDRLGASRPDAVVREPHTLCLVGWAQRVKDPLWAVEVLARLRADGHDWRLLLVGTDFADSPTASGAAHAKAFRARAMADDVRDHIDYTGFVEDLAPLLGRAGFVLSTSLRETWHVGAAEAVAAGAVPVIRDWPMLRSRGGARAIYPADWVVDSPEEAVGRITSLADPDARAAAATSAQEGLRGIADPVRTRTDLREVLLGDVGRLADLSERGEHEAALDLVRTVLATRSADPATLQQSAITATLAGEPVLRLDVLRRWVEVDPRETVRQLVRQQEGRLRELDPDWLPEVEAPSDPVQQVPGRVLHVLKVSLPHRQSGYALRSFYLLREQSRAGHDVRAVTVLDFPPAPGVPDPAAPGVPGDGTARGQAPEETVGEVRHLRLLRDQIPKPEHPDDYLTAFAAALLRVVREERPAIIHAHSGHRGYDIVRVALAVGEATGVPVVYEVRGFFEALWTSDLQRAERAEIYELRRRVETDSMQRAAAVVTLSESMREDIMARGIDSSRVFVVGNGVDPGTVVRREPRPDLANRLGLQGAFVFGYISNLDHYREGQELLVSAVRGLREAGLPAKALIVGGGSRLAPLQDLARHLGVSDHVVFTDQVPHDEIADYYALLDVFVVPRVDERAARLVTPLKPYEAMAMRLPLVVSALPALLEIIGDGDRGVSFPVCDADGLCRVLTELAGDPERRQALAERGHQWVLEQRTWQALAAHYQQVYAGVLGDPEGADQ